MDCLVARRMTWPRMTLSVWGILLAGAGREVHLAASDRVVDQFLVRKSPKRLGQLQFQEVVHAYVVDVAGRVGHQHSHRYLIGGQELREPARDLVVQADMPLLDQHQQERRHEGLGDPADAIVHIGGGRHGRHRVAHGHRQDLAVAHPHAKLDGLRAGLLGSGPDNGAHSIRIRVGRGAGDGLAPRSLRPEAA
jgi:hypothetical protein